MSPFTRKFVAVGLAILTLLLLISFVIMPVASAMQTSADELNDARFRVQRLEAVAAREPLAESQPLSPGLLLSAIDRQAAEAEFLSRVNAMLMSNGLTADGLTVINAGQRGDIMAVDLNITGPQEKLLRFIQNAETGVPAFRFRPWHLQAVPEAPGQIRLQGRILAAWMKP